MDVEIIGELLGGSDGALLIAVGKEEVWIPKSQILHERLNSDGTWSYTIPEWLAIERGLA